MDNSATVESTKRDESKPTSEKDHELDLRSSTAIEMVEKLLPKICESELGKGCEVSVDLHVFIPLHHNMKSKAKSVDAPSPNGK